MGTTKKTSNSEKKADTETKKNSAATKKTGTVTKKKNTETKKSSVAAKTDNPVAKKTKISPKKSYIIKVTFPNKSYRHIRLSENNTLEDLHEMIMVATDFFDEHLHSFFMDGVAWNEDSEIPCRRYTNTLKNSDASITFKMLNLPAGYKFLYIFDFGDEWRFRCRVMKIIDEDTEFPTIILSKGEPPEQYPDFDDEDEDDLNFIIK